MQCPNCGSQTTVVDTKAIEGSVYRTRRCKACHRDCTTVEQVVVGVWFSRKNGTVSKEEQHG